MSKDRLYLYNSFGCSGCSNSFLADANKKFAKGYEVVGFSWADSTITITKKSKTEPSISAANIKVINDWFKSQSQYSGYRVYSSLGDLQQEQKELQQKHWFDLCLSVLGFIVISLLNLLAFYLKSILLQQLLGVACGIVCTAVIFYLGSDLLPRLFVNSWADIKACISKPQDLTVRPSSLYEYLLVCIVALILWQALVSMSYGLFIGHMLCMNHFHCPLMIAMSFYAKQWFRTKIDSTILNSDGSKSIERALKSGGKAQSGQRILFKGKLSSDYAVFDASYTMGEPKKEIKKGDEIGCGWIYIGDEEIAITEECSGGAEAERRHGEINSAEKDRIGARAEIFNQGNMRSALQLAFLLVIAIIAPIVWHVFASGFGIVASFDMAFSIILIACPCRDFVKSFCYYLACRDLGSGIHLKGSGVYELLDNMISSPLRVGFDWTNTLQRDAGDAWSIHRLRAESRHVLNKLRYYVESIGVYSGTEKINSGDIAIYKQLLNLNHFFVEQSSDNKKAQVRDDDVNLYIGDNHNDILAGLAAKVFIAINNKDAVHDAYNPIRYADIVLDDTLEPLPELLQKIAIAKKAAYMVGVINAVYNVCALFLACGGYFYLFGVFLSPVTASFIMLGSMLLNFSCSIVFTAVLARWSYGSLASICDIGEGLCRLEEKRVVEDALGYVRKDRLHDEVSELAAKAAKRYPYGYMLFAIGGHVVTTRGVLPVQEYTVRKRLGAIANKWQKSVSRSKVNATASNSFVAKLYLNHSFRDWANLFSPGLGPRSQPGI